MTKFSTLRVTDLLGPAPISTVTDDEIWTLLVSPQTKALLGQIEALVEDAKVYETDSPLFPGDEISNLNDHRLYGGQKGYLRFPYTASVYKTENGYLVIKRDLLKFKVFAWLGDVYKGKGEMIFKFALRDRRYDGTRRANDCALLDFPYDDAAHNSPLPSSGVEISVYAFEPGSRIGQKTGDHELEEFVANPFKFLDRPETYLKLFQRAWESGRSPGQVGSSIADVAKFIAPNAEVIAKKYGYDFIEDAASHYHVAMYAMAFGYRCSFAEHAKQLADMRGGIERLKASGVKLSRPQESWVCALQSLPKEMIPPHLYLGGPFWPQDNISQVNLWMNKPLTERAQQLLPGPIARDGSPLPPAAPPGKAA